MEMQHPEAERPNVTAVKIFANCMKLGSFWALLHVVVNEKKGEPEIPILIPALAVSCDGDGMAEVQGAGLNLWRDQMLSCFISLPDADCSPHKYSGTVFGLRKAVQATLQ